MGDKPADLRMHDPRPASSETAADREAMRREVDREHARRFANPVGTVHTYTPQEQYQALITALRSICRVWDEDEPGLIEAFKGLKQSLDKLGDKVFGHGRVHPHVRFIGEWRASQHEAS